MVNLRIWSRALLLLVSFAQSVKALEPNSPPVGEIPSFANEIYPVVQRKCSACHAAGENGNLPSGPTAEAYYEALTTKAPVTPCDPPITEKNGKIRLDLAVAKVNSEETFFYLKVFSDRCGKMMAKQALMSPTEIANFKAWLKAGAPKN